MKECGGVGPRILISMYYYSMAPASELPSKSVEPNFGTEYLGIIISDSMELYIPSKGTVSCLFLNHKTSRMKS